jgi:uncharacterized membrane protein
VIEERPALGPVVERRLGRLLIVVTYAAVGVLVAGVLLLLAAGVSPLDGGPALEVASLGRLLVGLDPAGFLWLGLLVVIATPITRVILAGAAYLRDGDWSMVAISLVILAVIALGVATAGTGLV